MCDKADADPETEGACGMDYSLLPSDDDGDGDDSDSEWCSDSGSESKDAEEIHDIGSQSQDDGDGVAFDPKLKDIFSKKNNWEKRNEKKKDKTEDDIKRQIYLSKFAGNMKGLLQNRNAFEQSLQNFHPVFPEDLAKDELFICELVRYIFRDALYVVPANAWKYTMDVFPKIILKICSVYPGMKEIFVKENENLCKLKYGIEIFCDGKRKAKKERSKKPFQILLKKKGFLNNSKRKTSFLTFMGSLCNYKLLSPKFIVEFVDMLLEKKSEESCETLCFLLNSIWKKTVDELDELERESKNLSLTSDLSLPMGQSYVDKTFATIKKISLDRSLALSEEIRSSMAELVQLRGSTSSTPMFHQTDSQKNVEPQINQPSSSTSVKTKRERRREERFNIFGPPRSTVGVTPNNDIGLSNPPPPPPPLMSLNNCNANLSEIDTNFNRPDFFSYVRVFDHGKNTNVILNTSQGGLGTNARPRSSGSKSTPTTPKTPGSGKVENKKAETTFPIRRVKLDSTSESDRLKLDWLTDFRKNVKEVTKERKEFWKLFRGFKPFLPKEYFTHSNNSQNEDFASEIIGYIFREAIHTPGFSWRSIDNIYGRITKKLCDSTTPYVSKLLKLQMERQCEEEVEKYIVRDVMILRDMELGVDSYSKNSGRLPKTDQLNSRKIHVKRRNAGFFSYMSSLCNLDLLSPKFIVGFIDMLLAKQTEESLESLCLLLKSISSKIEEFGNTNKPNQFRLPDGYIDRLLANLTSSSFDSTLSLSEEIRNSIMNIVVGWNAKRRGISQMDQSQPQSQSGNQRKREIYKESFASGNNGGGKAVGPFTKKVKGKVIGNATADAVPESESRVNLSDEDESSLPTLPSQSGSSRSSFSFPFSSRKDSFGEECNKAFSAMADAVDKLPLNTVSVPVLTTNKPLTSQTTPKAVKVKPVFSKIDFIGGGVESHAEVNKDEVNVGPGPVQYNIVLFDLVETKKTLIEILCTVSDSSVDEYMDKFFTEILKGCDGGLNEEKTVSLGGRLIIAKALLDPRNVELYALMISKIYKYPNPERKFLSKSVLDLIEKKFKENFQSDVDEEIEILECQLNFSTSSELMDTNTTYLELERRRELRRKTKSGIVTLIGHLYKLRVLPARIFSECLLKILDVETNESYEAGCTLLNVAGQMMENELKEFYDPNSSAVKSKKGKVKVMPPQDLMDTVFEKLTTFSISYKCSPNVRMEILGLIGLRRNNWRWILDGPVQVRILLPQDKSKKKQSKPSQPEVKFITFGYRGPPELSEPKPKPTPVPVQPPQVQGTSILPNKDKGSQNLAEAYFKKTQNKFIPPRLLDIDKQLDDKAETAPNDGIVWKSGAGSGSGDAPATTQATSSKSKRFKKKIEPIALLDENEIEAQVRKTNTLLNKLTPMNVNGIAKEFCELFKKNYNVDDTIHLVTPFIFERAISQPALSSLYVQMLKLAMAESKSNSGVCSFENEFGLYLQGFIEDNVERLCGGQNLNQEEGRHGERKILFGLITFMGDLFIESLLSYNNIINCLTKLIGWERYQDESYELICTLLTPAVGAKLEKKLKKRNRSNMTISLENSPVLLAPSLVDLLEDFSGGDAGSSEHSLGQDTGTGDTPGTVTHPKFMDTLFSTLNVMTLTEDKCILTPRVRFAVLDLIELRENSWKPRDRNYERPRQFPGERIENVKFKDLEFNPSGKKQRRKVKDPPNWRKELMNHNPCVSTSFPSIPKSSAGAQDLRARMGRLMSPNNVSVGVPVSASSRSVSNLPSTPALPTSKGPSQSQTSSSPESTSPSKLTSFRLSMLNHEPMKAFTKNLNLPPMTSAPSSEENGDSSAKSTTSEKLDTSAFSAWLNVEDPNSVTASASTSVNPNPAEDSRGLDAGLDTVTKKKVSNRKMYDRDLLMSLKTSLQAQIIPECVKDLACYYMTDYPAEKLTKKEKKRFMAANFDVVPPPRRMPGLGRGFASPTSSSPTSSIGTRTPTPTFGLGNRQP